LIVLLLGSDPLAEKLRAHFERERRTPRQSTRKILSLLSIALHVLSDPRWQQQAQKR
jgi:hypothetical protein